MHTYLPEEDRTTNSLAAAFSAAMTMLAGFVVVAVGITRWRPWQSQDLSSCQPHWSV
jgi:hypothetical protein